MNAAFLQRNPRTIAAFRRAITQAQQIAAADPGAVQQVQRLGWTRTDFDVKPMIANSAG